MRYFFEIVYRGGGYHGWQNQANALGVQQVAEEALSKIFRKPIAIVGSGRTDAGVHCTQQFFHADIEDDFKPEEWLRRLNSFLPRDISIREVKPDAHARYSAISRSYLYRITTTKNPMLSGMAFRYFKPLDISLMNEAARLIAGEHNFESFSKVKTDVNHFRCHVKNCKWEKKGEEILFHITANRFLRGMVRALTGTMLDVGTKKISIDNFKEILNSRDRRKAGMNVSPDGLYLCAVKYPKSIFKK